MKRAIYTALYIISVLGICEGLVDVKNLTIYEAEIAVGIVTIIAIAIYRSLFDEFK